MSKINEELKNDPLMPLRHSAEHILHMSVESLFENSKKVMGPPIEGGFYGDFHLETDISNDDLEKIAQRMKEIIDADLPLKMKEISYEEAKEIFSDNPYKLELIEEFNDRGDKISVVEVGEAGDEFHDIDLCAGPHVNRTSEIKAFKLQNIAGAYWRGDEQNEMLTRIYATAFDSEEKLNEYLQKLEEAKQRDHRILGPQLGIFFLHESAPGMPYWLPNGTVMINELMKFWREEHKKREYKETITPLVNKKVLWETSGHWEHYQDGMFIADMGENEVYGVKPMNCPNAMNIFKHQLRSYRELPLRISDADTLHRYEKSGELHGLLRVQEFRQDDAHIFITEDQIEEEYRNILDIAELFYGIFGLEYKLRLGTRPEKFLGDPKIWDKAEKILEKILNDRVGKDNYIYGDKEGAFYGPKIDILMQDSLGRKWQTGTIQLDFQLPERFDLKYVSEEGSYERPVVVHRVIYGSIERFMGILIEHFGGAFPVWISPIQVQLIPISEKQNEYAQNIKEQLQKEGIRIEINDKDDTLGAKIRDAQIQKVPYMGIIGGREEKNNEISIRLRTEEDKGAMPVEEFINKVKEINLTKSLQLW